MFWEPYGDFPSSVALDLLLDIKVMVFSIVIEIQEMQFQYACCYVG